MTIKMFRSLKVFRNSSILDENRAEESRGEPAKRRLKNQVEHQIKKQVNQRVKNLNTKEFKFTIENCKSRLLKEIVVIVLFVLKFSELKAMACYSSRYE